MMKVIVLGNDHTNTLGVVQCLGEVGYTPIPVVWGVRTGIVKSSKYVKDLYSASNAQSCIEFLINDFHVSNEITPIVCSCDGAALAVETNRDRLNKKFVSEYTLGQWSISELQEKNLQVKLASDSGFIVPNSFSLNANSPNIPEQLPFQPPYIFKALKSVEGDKGDLTICRTRQELIDKSKKTLTKTPRILVQQYIERDYEISLLGCALSNGECIIPAVENKLTLFPKNVGLECLAEIQPLDDTEIKSCISRLIERIGYVGLFSVEMMHCKNDGKFYFTEINLRNDGANIFIKKYGVNLPAIHISDITGVTWDQYNKPEIEKTGFYLWEIHHLYSLIHGDISIIRWIKEICKSKGGLVYNLKDFKPFIRQFLYPLLRKLRLTTRGNY